MASLLTLVKPLDRWRTEFSPKNNGPKNITDAVDNASPRGASSDACDARREGRNRKPCFRVLGF
eukprot:5204435-Pyramimonas_sp.AAC.1